MEMITAAVDRNIAGVGTATNPGREGGRSSSINITT